MDMRAASAALKTIALSLRQLSRVPAQASEDASTKIAGLIQQGFDRGVDPYGRPWAPLKASTLAKGRTPPPLTDTRELRKAEVKPAKGAGVSVKLGAQYGAFHQVGFHVHGKPVPARPPLPAHGLPKEWNAAIRESVEDAAEKALA